jgi:uncharacterized protein with PQ loop repeat
MSDFVILIGTLGSIAFALSGLPQAIKSIHDGHSKGISHGMLWLWLFGEVCMIFYSLYFYTYDFILISNYFINFVNVAVITKYKYWERNA